MDLQLVSDWPLTDAYVNIIKTLRDKEFSEITGINLLGPESEVTPDPVLMAGPPPEWWVPGEHLAIPVPSFRETMFTAGGVTKLEHGIRLLVHGSQVPQDYDYSLVTADSQPPEIVGELLAVDIEVGGDINEDEPEDCPLLSVAICWQNAFGTEHIWVWGEEALQDLALLEMLAWILVRNTLIMHNGKFDARWLNTHLAQFLQRKLYPDEDTQGMHYVQFHGAGEHDLKSLCHRIFGAPDWEADIKKYTKGSKAHYERIPKLILYKYNAGDVHWTYALYIRLRHWLDLNHEANALYFDHWLPMTHMYQDIEEFGMHIDMDYAKELDEKFAKETEQLLDRLRVLAGSTEKLFTPENYDAKVMPKVFNPGSPKQVLHLLHSNGYFVPGTGEDILVSIRMERERFAEEGKTDITAMIDALLEYRHVTKAHSTYVLAVLRRARGDRIHPQFLTARTSTGRTASRGPNVQNVSNDEEGVLSLRRMYDAAPGRVLVAADFAQAELRVMAELSDDEKMIAALQEDSPDFFTAMMPLIWPDLDLQAAPSRVVKANRLRLKRVVYGSSYGLTARSVAYLLTVQANVPTSEQDAQHIQDAYLGIYPGLRQWREERMEVFQTQGLITPFGRRFQQDYLSHGNFHRVQNQAWAFSPQSIASDICVDAAISLHKLIKKHYRPEEVHLTCTVHDQIIAESLPEHAPTIAEWMEDRMRKAGAKVYDRVPFIAEAKIGRTWDLV